MSIVLKKCLTVESRNLICSYWLQIATIETNMMIIDLWKLYSIKYPNCNFVKIQWIFVFLFSWCSCQRWHLRGLALSCCSWLLLTIKLLVYMICNTCIFIRPFRINCSVPPLWLMLHKQIHLFYIMH